MLPNASGEVKIYITEVLIVVIDSNNDKVRLKDIVMRMLCGRNEPVLPANSNIVIVFLEVDCLLENVLVVVLYGVSVKLIYRNSIVIEEI